MRKVKFNEKLKIPKRPLLADLEAFLKSYFNFRLWYKK